VNYVPDPSNLSALNVRKKVKVHFIVIQPTVPGHNYKISDSNRVKNIVFFMNDYLSKNDTPNHPQANICGDCNIHDARLQVECTGVTYVTDNDPDNITPYLYNNDRELDIFLTYNPSSIYGGGAGGATQMPSAYPWDELVNGKNVPPSTWPLVIKLMNYYVHGYDTTEWNAAANALHEMGHALGLNHLYQDTGFICCQEMCDETNIDYLLDIFNTGSNKHCLWPQVYIWGLDDSLGYTNNLMGSSLGTYLSPLQLGRLHRNSHFLAGRNFVYNVDPPDQTPWNITKDETWDFDIRMFTNIIVKSGHTLTVKCRIQMPEDGQIIVEPGARLVIDGGIVTSYNGVSMWDGIVALGTANKSQDPDPSATGPYLAWQGMVKLQGGAILENAERAVMLWDPSGDYSKTGGFLMANSATFRNCFKGVETAPYHNFSVGNPAIAKPNRTQLTNCTFEWTQAPNHPGASYGMTLWEVDGVTVQGCTFRSLLPNQPDYVATTGIMTYDASCAIDRYCVGTATPCNNFIGNTFTGLDEGINAAHIYGTQSSTVRASTFTDNKTSIDIAGLQSFEISGNDFNVGNPDATQSTSFGITIDGSQGYLLYSNNFIGSSTGYGGTRTGLVVKNGGSADVEVKNNAYAKLYAANVSNYLNTNGAIVGPAHGLQFLCNDYKQTDYDESVLGDNPGIHGMRRAQGSNTQSAGNVFSGSGNSGGTHMHITAPSSQVLNLSYFFGTSSGSEPTLINTAEVNKIATNLGN
jgi:hypothetical protein